MYSIAVGGIILEFEKKSRYEMDDLLHIMEILRGPDGCPWDREQTHESIRGNLIEETYEAVEAIDRKDTALLREELGDVLLQVVFHSRMEEEQGSFQFGDVVHDICQKLIIRHPHIFGDVQVSGTGEVLENWEAIKNAVLYNGCICAISFRLLEKEVGAGSIHVVRNLEDEWNRSFYLVYHKDRLITPAIKAVQAIMEKYKTPDFLHDVRMGILTRT